MVRTDTAALIEKLHALGIDGAQKYLEEFDGSTFVVKCGGALLEDESTGALVLDDIALLSRAGIRVVLVHGGSVQADCEMLESGIEPRRYKGLRITCDRTIEILERCFGSLNRRIVELLRGRGIDAVGFSGSENGGLLMAEKLHPDGVDIGRVGHVTDVQISLLDSLRATALPVISSLGVDDDGCALNINADYAATQLALRIGARKLILLTDVQGVLLDRNDPSTLISTLTCSHARKLIEDKVIDSGMIPKIESAVNAVEAGLNKLHIVSGAAPHALAKELFTDEGCGTQIVKG